MGVRLCARLKTNKPVHHLSANKNLLQRPKAWFSFLFINCGLWTLSCDFVSHNYETLKLLSSLLTLCRSHSGDDSVAIGIYIISLCPHRHAPSLISLTVSVDVKHRVYLLCLRRDQSWHCLEERCRKPALGYGHTPTLPFAK